MRDWLGARAKDFFTGILGFLPLLVFVLILYYLFLGVQYIGVSVFGLTHSWEATTAILLCSVLLVVYAGHKLRRREKWFFQTIEKGIAKLPVVGGWYVTFRDLVASFSGGSGKEYLGVVKVPFGGGYVIGFVTKRELDENGQATVAVFTPTSPNPTTGLVFFFPESAIEYTDITPETAFARILSLGAK